MSDIFIDSVADLLDLPCHILRSLFNSVNTCSQPLLGFIPFGFHWAVNTVLAGLCSN